MSVVVIRTKAPTDTYNMHCDDHAHAERYKADIISLIQRGIVKMIDLGPVTVAVDSIHSIQIKD